MKKNILKSSLLLMLFIFLNISLKGASSCFCNNGCYAPVGGFLRDNQKFDEDPTFICPGVCRSEGGWSGHWSTEPYVTPYC